MKMRRFRLWLLDVVIQQNVRAYLELDPGTYVRHALFSEAFSARMFSDHPDLSADAKKAYRWAEEQFVRIANGKVGERDLIG